MGEELGGEAAVAVAEYEDLEFFVGECRDKVGAGVLEEVSEAELFEEAVGAGEDVEGARHGRD